MAGSGPSRTGVCVIRAWVEGDAEAELRATITHTRDITAGGEVVEHTGNVPDSLDVVAAWLRGVLSCADDGSAPTGDT